jgi:hypothetical protein
MLDERSAPWRVLSAAALLHLAMFVWDGLHPDTISHADRYEERLTNMQRLLACFGEHIECGPGGTVAALTQQGIPGDYLLHAVLYGLGGTACIIFVQILLMLLSIYCVYRIVEILAASQAAAVSACALYGVLPHTIVLPHVLGSEALYDPLLVIAFWLLAEGWRLKFKCSWLWLAGLLFGVATLVRPVTLLWPIVVMVPILIARSPRLAAAGFLGFAYLPVLLWVGFVGIQTGRPSLGESSHDMSHNLRDRAERIIELLPSGQQTAARERYLPDAGKTMATTEYFRFGWEYPYAFAQHLGRDALVFLGKSGVEKLTFDYFGADESLRADLQNEDTGWRHQMEVEGLATTIYSIATRAPGILLSSLVGSALLVTLWAGYAVSGWKLLAGIGSNGRQRHGAAPESSMLALAVFLFPLYVFAVSQAVDAMQSRHRAPAEFAICIFAALGIFALRNFRLAVSPVVEKGTAS